MLGQPTRKVGKVVNDDQIYLLYNAYISLQCILLVLQHVQLPFPLHILPERFEFTLDPLRKYDGAKSKRIAAGTTKNSRPNGTARRALPYVKDVDKYRHVWAVLRCFDSKCVTTVDCL